jgi:hypothetical protein
MCVSSWRWNRRVLLVISFWPCRQSRTACATETRSGCLSRPSPRGAPPTRRRGGG